MPDGKIELPGDQIAQNQYIMCVYRNSCVSRSIFFPFSATPRTVACQALSMGFSRQEYWSGLPCPISGDKNREIHTHICTFYIHMHKIK